MTTYRELATERQRRYRESNREQIYARRKNKNINFPTMWTHEKTLKLIELWHKKTILWDSKHKDYRNRDLKREAFEILASEFEMPTSDIEKKMMGLKNQFRREHNKMKQTGSMYSVEWFGYRPLLFLLESYNQRETIDSYHEKMEFPDQRRTPSELCIESDIFLPSDSMNYVDFKEEKEEENRPVNNEEHVEYQSFIPCKRKKLKLNETYGPTGSGPTINPYHQNIDSVPLNDMFAEALKTKTTILPPRDEFAIYGDYIANCLRKYKDQHSVLVAQNKINNVLFDGAIGRFCNFIQGPTTPITNDEHTVLNPSATIFYRTSTKKSHTSECSSTKRD